MVHSCRMWRASALSPPLSRLCRLLGVAAQHGNVAKVLHTGLFDALLRIDGGTLKTVHPLPEFAAVSSLIDEALYTKLTACVTAVQQEKKRRVRIEGSRCARAQLQRRACGAQPPRFSGCSNAQGC